MFPKQEKFGSGRKYAKCLRPCRAPSTSQGDVTRAQIVLFAAEGRSTRSIAKQVGVQPPIVSKWRHRFADHGLGGERSSAGTRARLVVNAIRFAEKRWRHVPTVAVQTPTSVQALDRRQPLPPMRAGHAERRPHDYKRNGTTSLLAAFDVKAGTAAEMADGTARRNACALDHSPAT